MTLRGSKILFTLPITDPLWHIFHDKMSYENLISEMKMDNC